ncbi:MAG: hypothetical protein ACSHWN_11275 [Methylophilaceae bacterium]
MTKVVRVRVSPSAPVVVIVVIRKNGQRIQDGDKSYKNNSFLERLEI